MCYPQYFPEEKCVFHKQVGKWKVRSQGARKPGSVTQPLWTLVGQSCQLTAWKEKLISNSCFFWKTYEVNLTLEGRLHGHCRSGETFVVFGAGSDLSCGSSPQSTSIVVYPHTLPQPSLMLVDSSEPIQTPEGCWEKWEHVHWLIRSAKCSPAGRFAEKKPKREDEVWFDEHVWEANWAIL